MYDKSYDFKEDFVMSLGDSASGFDGLGFVGLHKHEEAQTPMNILGLKKCESGGGELSEDSNIYVSQHNPEQTKLRKHEPVNDFAMFGLSL